MLINLLLKYASFSQAAKYVSHQGDGLDEPVCGKGASFIL